MSTIKILKGLLVMAVPMAGWMCLAILLGTAGFMTASAIPSLAAWSLGQPQINFGMLAALLAVCAISRGLLRYGEQACNHYIAFKLLAAIRDKVFGALRKLAPAKLDTRSQGDLVETITRDVELLEVFYAHTISPVCITLLCTLLYTAIGWAIHPLIGICALSSYVLTAVLPALLFGKKARHTGDRLRKRSGRLSAFVLEQARGLFDLLQFHKADQKLKTLNAMTDGLYEDEEAMKDIASASNSLVNVLITCSGLVMILVCNQLYQTGAITVSGFALAVAGQLSTFGPVSALASLAAAIAPTLAAGARVLSLLEEEPVTEEIISERKAAMGELRLSDVTFAYDKTPVLEHLDLNIGKGIVAVNGPSGCGKSTLLRLLMRFYDPQKGTAALNNASLQTLDTRSLRSLEGVVLQDTYLFADTVENNLKIVREDASQREMEDACKKAAIHDLIMSLPQGYQTSLACGGSSLSAGERQRLGLARAFLHDSQILLLDEPTSNLDVLNEGAILRSIARHARDRMVVLVSHRPGSLAIARRQITMKGNRHEY